MTNDQPIPPTPERERDSNNDVAHPESNAAPEMKAPPSHASYTITTKTERDKWDIAKFIAEFVGLGFLILYTLYTAGIYCANRKAAEAAHDTLGEIQKQTKVMRQQLVGSQAALLHLDDIHIDATGKLEVVLHNVGHVTATDVHFQVTVTRETIADQRPIEPPITFEPAIIEPIKVEGIWPPDDWHVPWRPHQLTQQHEWPHGWPGKETFSLRGSFSYNNGFGDKQTEEFCRQWLPNFEITTKLQGSSGGGMFPRDQFRSAIHSILGLEEKAESEH